MTSNTQGENPAGNAPSYVLDLQQHYGPASAAGIGSAVFYEASTAEQIEAQSIAKYRYFAGNLWDQIGEKAWMDTWKMVYQRSGPGSGILSELRNSIEDPAASLSASLIVDNIDNPDQAHLALAKAFDDPNVSRLVIYRLGDGEQMNGVLIAAYRAKSSDATFLVSLTD
ncbi:MAG: hypothetical protein FJ308_16865 [Planctomycetes bacterium]|nr:hypothetical protein [Planctomycetota bacterium]